MSEIEFELSYAGNDADNHELDFYDAAEALIGFQRSLALTTHLILNGEIITQAPSLKGAEIMVRPPKTGSWTILAFISWTGIVGGGLGALYKLGTAPRGTPLGNLVSSVYDYLISESLGFHVDYDKTLGQQYEIVQGYKQKQKIEPPSLIVPKESQMDSLAEKCETAIKQMHRPIVGKGTALNGMVACQNSRGKRNTQILNRDTYNYISITKERDTPTDDIGRISSYNSNTFKGRIYSLTEKRPIPFELSDAVRNPYNIQLITQSLTENALSKSSENGYIGFEAYRIESQTGLLKKLYIINVRRATVGEVLMSQI